uniref:ARID domain-containing protein n=1 Tax=Mesocestoides corti TaxID=53468 RepID=A0A0R3UC64_MESCO
LDVEDMVRMKVPDWKCVFTQIQFYYRKLNSPAGPHPHAPPAADSAQLGDGPSA